MLNNGGDTGGAPHFQDESTLPVWLSAAGYTTALFGKYMKQNDLIAPRVPPGWDVWQTFVENGGGADGRVYYDYTLNENGRLVPYGDTPREYSTDLLRDRTFLIENYGAIIVLPNRAVRTTRWKFIRTLPDNFDELYDLAADPYELENRAGDPSYANVRAGLAARLAELEAE